jgi:hypothetical protein
MSTRFTKEYRIETELMGKRKAFPHKEMHRLYDLRKGGQQGATVYDEALLEKILYADDLAGDID